MTTKDYWRAVRVARKWIIAASLLGLILGIAATVIKSSEGQYMATARVAVFPDKSRPNSVNETQLKTIASNIANLAQSLEDPEYGEQDVFISVRVPQNTSVIAISVTAHSEETAEQTLDKYVNDFLTLSHKQLEDTPYTISSVTDQTAFKAKGDNPVKAGLLGVFAGLVISIGAAILRELLSGRITSEDKAVASSNAPVFGRIPAQAKQEEPYRALNAVITTRFDARSILVTSASNLKDSNDVALGLAKAQLSEGKSVVVVYTSEILATSTDPDGGVTTELITPHNNESAFSAETLQKEILDRQAKYDSVIFATAPVDQDASAILVANLVDAIAVTVPANAVQADYLAACVNELTPNDSTLAKLGLVLTAIPTKGPDVGRYGLVSR